MKKGYNQKVEKEITIIQTVCCNKCGKEFHDKQWIGRVHELTIDFTHYYSRFDGHKWNFDLCEECIVKFVQSFKYEPNGITEEITCEEHKEEVKPLIKQVKENEVSEESYYYLQELNHFSVLNSGRATKNKKEQAYDFVLIEQTNQFCHFLEKVKPLEWEEYLHEYGDGEFVNILPLANELGAEKYQQGYGFL